MHASLARDDAESRLSETDPDRRPQLAVKTHPLSKLSMLLAAFACAIVLPKTFSAVLLVIMALVAMLHGSGRRFINGLVAVSTPFALSLLLISAADPAASRDWWSIGPLGFGSDQLAWAAGLLLRVMLLVGSVHLYVIMTPLDELHSALVRARVPKSFAYAVSAAAGFVPHLRQRVLEVRDAQTSRGVRFGWGSAGAISLIGPLLLSALEEAAEREVTLLVRGFGLPDRPTTLAGIPWRQTDTAVAAAAVLATAAALLWRLLGA